MTSPAEFEQRIEWCRNQTEHGYNATRLSIQFQPCGFKTFNQNDINNHYCPACKRFIDDVKRIEEQNNETGS